MKNPYVDKKLLSNFALGKLADSIRRTLFN